MMVSVAGSRSTDGASATSLTCDAANRNERRPLKYALSGAPFVIDAMMTLSTLRIASTEAVTVVLLFRTEDGRTLSNPAPISLELTREPTTVPVDTPLVPFAVLVDVMPTSGAMRGGTLEAVALVLARGRMQVTNYEQLAEATRKILTANVVTPVEPMGLSAATETDAVMTATDAAGYDWARATT